MREVASNTAPIDRFVSLQRDGNDAETAQDS